MSNQFFMAIFAVKYFNMAKMREEEKTISSYVSLYDNFERTIDKFCERFAKQEFTLLDINVFISDTDFRDIWEEIKQDNSVAWGKKNKELLARRPDISDKNVYCAEGRSPRKYR